MVRTEQRVSIRKRIYAIWVENPLLRAKEICSELGLQYNYHGNYVNKLLSEFRSSYDLGLPLGPQELHKRTFVWESIPRSLLLDHLGCNEREVGEGFRALGWEISSNRNEMLVFPDRRGTVHWYKGGLVRSYLRKPATVAKAKELFCRAFSWFDWKELSRYVDVPLREESRHWVFDVGKPVPRFDIRKFKRSHGIRVYSDKSHLNAVEVEETVPFWIGELQDTAQSFGRIVNQLGVEIKEHMKLIREWQKEAKARSDRCLPISLRQNVGKTTKLLADLLKKVLKTVDTR